MPAPTVPSSRPNHVGETTELAHTGAVCAIPLRPVEPRADAVLDAAALHLTNAAAVKRNTFPSRPGYPSGKAHLQTHLHVETWVANRTYTKHVWVDVHVFAHDGVLVHAVTLPLVYARPAGDDGDLFVLEAELFDGSIATPGSVEPKPDVRLVQYRLYAELQGAVLTDGVLHRCLLVSDASSR